MTPPLASTDYQLLSLGVLVVVSGLVLFAGSIYLLLAAQFGKKMAYFIEATCFFAFLTLLAAIWTFGFYSQGTTTPTNQGPRGSEPHWQPIAGGLEASSEKYPVSLRYPGDPWKEPNEGQQSSVDPLSTAVKEFMADRANEQAGIEVKPEIPVAAGGQGAPEYEPDKVPFEASDFTVEDVRFTTEGGKSLAAARVFYASGGPEMTVIAVHEPGAVWTYSWGFLIASVIGFLFHLSFLDREEKKLKGIITSKPTPWTSGGAK